MVILNKIRYLIGKYITGRNTFLYSSYKPNSAGSFRMRDKVTILNINSMPVALSKISENFQKQKINQISDFEVDNEIIESVRTAFNKHGSDKAAGHGYENIYAYVISRFTKKINLLEIGIGSNNEDTISNMGKTGKPGASLFAFSELLPDSNIYGADIDRRILFNTKNIKTDYLNQMDYSTYEKLHSNFGKINFDIIIDDGLHIQSANLNTLLFSLKNLNNGGFLIIEDIPEFALNTWFVVNTLLDKNYQLNVIKANTSYLVLIEKH